MKTLLKYLRPYRWLVVLTIILAAINTGFSLIDPIIFGEMVNLGERYLDTVPAADEAAKAAARQDFFFSWSVETPGVILLLLASIGVAMVRRIAKNLQDYFLSVVVQKFGAKVFTDGL